jgi:hypothetical protein
MHQRNVAHAYPEDPDEIDIGSTAAVMTHRRQPEVAGECGPGSRKASEVWFSSLTRCEERTQNTFLPSRLEDYVIEDNDRLIDDFVGELDLTGLGFEGMCP